MKRAFHIVVIVAALLCATPLRASAEAPQRIVSLKPNITEIVYALGRGEALVGRTRYCDYPPEAQALPVAGDYTRPFIERIVALHPDLVLASEENSQRRAFERLQAMGVRIVLFDFSTIAATIASVRAIGRAIGAGAAGDRLAAKMQKALQRPEKNSATKRPRALLVVGVRPIIAAGPGSYLDELIPTAGLTNAVVDRSMRYPRLALEELIALDPEVIVDCSMGSEEHDRGSPRPWEGIAALRAVREGRVVPCDMGRLRPGPRLPAALADLAKHVARVSKKTPPGGKTR